MTSKKNRIGLRYKTCIFWEIWSTTEMIDISDKKWFVKVAFFRIINYLLGNSWLSQFTLLKTNFWCFCIEPRLEDLSVIRVSSDWKQACVHSTNLIFTEFVSEMMNSIFGQWKVILGDTKQLHKIKILKNFFLLNIVRYSCFVKIP